MSVQYQIAGKSASAIAESLERAIDAGRLGGDDRLPTIRVLADRLGVSPTTVNAAFGILRRRGRIVGRRRGGSIVVGRTGFQTAALESALPPHGRNLAVADPDPAFLPLIRRALGAGLVERRLYTDIRDSPTLLKVARSALTRDGVPAENVGIAGGAMDTIERALLATVAPGDRIAVEDPTYPQYVELARALDLRIVRVRIDARGIVPAGLRDALRLGIKALITIPRAHNPTGVSLAEPRASELRRELAKAPGLLVIEDDFLAEVSGVALCTLTTASQRWIHVRSYAKLLGPDLRVATFAGDELTTARMRERQRLGSGWVSLILQEAAAALLTDAGTKRLFRAAQRAYRLRREAFIAALARHGVRAASESGFTVWIPVRDEAATVRNAQAAGFAIDGGARYRESAPPGVRVTITTLRPAEAERLAAAIAASSTPGP